MGKSKFAGCVFALLLGCSALQLASTSLPLAHSTRQTITAAPSGPFHVAGNQVVDSRDRPFLMRGTQLTPFDPQTVARDNRAGEEFGPHSATGLSAIRLRFNMNTVRLPVNVLESGGAEYFSGLAKVVRRANDIDLLVILDAREPGAELPSRKTAEFWSQCAAFFKDYPNVIFDVFSAPSPAAVSGDAHSAAGWNLWKRGGQAADGREVIGMNDLVQAIRATGARQPIAVMSWKDDRLFEGAGLLDDRNIIYEASLGYGSMRSDAERDARFGFLSDRAPVLAADWDLKLDDAAACSLLPADPTATASLVQDNLNYFDARRISWTVSSFEPGKLVKDFYYHDATTLENGWTCGQANGLTAGLGRVIQAHLRASVERGLFVVSGSGGVDVARGGYALAYGPIMAERDTTSSGPSVPTRLAGLEVRITDAKGVTRPAGILWASEGWGQVNFVVPAESAVGPAQMMLVRADGSKSASATNITIAETAPGFVTGHSCRGPAIGEATQVFADGRKSITPLSACDASRRCSTIAVPMASGSTTRVQLDGAGFRHADSAAKIEVTIGGVRVPVVGFAASDNRGRDHLTIEIPASMNGLGETDLICHLNGRVSNAVRIRIGGSKPIS